MSNSSDEMKKYLNMLSDEDSSVRRQALLYLGDYEDAETIKVIAEKLKDPSHGVQQTVADILIRISGRDVVENTMPFLKDESPSVRNLAVEVLESVGGCAVDIIMAATADVDPDVRKFAIDVLGIIKADNSYDTLVALLSDENPNVRAATAEALGKMGDMRAVNPLVNLLGDEEWVRFSVIEALSELGDKALFQF